ncbi:MAG: ABC transporter ATP-binding protein, partial [Oscillatoria sp. PMC 1076.18]|nr:ABC transporter ATP-binding protein [Oscillatoria sp. PMC 1076.18]
MSNDRVLVEVENLSKKFCRDLKTSLWYGVKDIGREFLGGSKETKLRRDEFWAVDDVSFQVRRGECLGLIGPNGAGKSTLLKMLNGLIKPDQGKITMRGRVGSLIELGVGFNPILTGRENIYTNAAVLGLTKAEVEKKMDAIAEFSELEDFFDTPVQNYSSGMKVRLGFAIAAQMEPDVLLLDEVLAVGDVGFRAKCFNTLHQKMSNAAVILVSHSMPQISRLCSDLVVMKHGKVEFKGQDVARGIDKFYTYFAAQENVVIGNGKAVVHNVELESNGKRGIDKINYLDELIVHLETTIDSEVKQPNIVIAFANQSLQMVAQCYSIYNDFEINNSGEKMKLTLNLGKINLNPG